MVLPGAHLAAQCARFDTVTSPAELVSLHPHKSDTPGKRFIWLGFDFFLHALRLLCRRFLLHVDSCERNIRRFHALSGRKLSDHVHRNMIMHLALILKFPRTFPSLCVP
jgi:hypothetical protein